MYQRGEVSETMTVAKWYSRSLIVYLFRRHWLIGYIVSGCILMQKKDKKMYRKNTHQLQGRGYLGGQEQKNEGWGVGNCNCNHLFLKEKGSEAKMAKCPHLLMSYMLGRDQDDSCIFPVWNKYSLIKNFKVFQKKKQAKRNTKKENSETKGGGGGKAWLRSDPEIWPWEAVTGRRGEEFPCRGKASAKAWG